jgi:twitching motility protein PilT
MVGTPAIRNLIREAKVAQMYSAIQTDRRDGMQTLDQNMKELVDAGKITSKAAMVKAVNRDMFR